MGKTVSVQDHIRRLIIPYKNIFTSVFLISTPQGYLLYDTAACGADVDGYVLPWLKQQGVTEQNLRYIVISHDHTDHAGGLDRLFEVFPSITAVARGHRLQERFGSRRIWVPADGELLAEDVCAVTVDGHTMDGIALYDRRTRTLLTGDSLQLYGIFGADFWGANISYPTAHLQSLEKLRHMDVDRVLFAHDYHPMGLEAQGRDAFLQALEHCRAPLLEVVQLLKNHPQSDDEAVRAMYNASGGRPIMGRHVVTAVRAAMAADEM